MKWLDAIRRKRRLRNAIAEAVFQDVYTSFPLTDVELQHILVGGPRRPLGDVVAGEFFLSDNHRRFKYLVALTNLLRCCTRILNDDRSPFPPNFHATTSEVAEAIDPLLDYLLNAVEFICDRAGGLLQAGAEAFFAIPRNRCGTRTHAHLVAIEQNERLFAGLRELARHYKDSGKA